MLQDNQKTYNGYQNLQGFGQVTKVFRKTFGGLMKNFIRCVRVLSEKASPLFYGR